MYLNVFSFRTFLSPFMFAFVFMRVGECMGMGASLGACVCGLVCACMCVLARARVYMRGRTRACMLVYLCPTLCFFGVFGGGEVWYCFSHHYSFVSVQIKGVLFFT